MARESSSYEAAQEIAEPCRGIDNGIGLLVDLVGELPTQRVLVAAILLCGALAGNRKVANEMGIDNALAVADLLIAAAAQQVPKDPARVKDDPDSGTNLGELSKFE